MLHALKPYFGSTHRRRRVGRGNASGRGTTAGRGTKGQQSRAGKGRRLGFEGGQTPLIRRQPKLGGFRNPNRTEYEIVNVGTLESRLQEGSYDVAALSAAGLIHGRHPVKLLGRGQVTKKFTVIAHAASKHAKEAIEKAGGTVTIMRLK